MSLACRSQTIETAGEAAGVSNHCVFSGRVYVNDIERPLSTFKSLVGFVPQEDVMIRNLTVEENLRFCAFARLPRGWTDARKLQVVHECVADASPCWCGLSRH